MNTPSVTATDVGIKLILVSLIVVVLSAAGMVTAYAIDRAEVAAQRASHHTAYTAPEPSTLEIVLKERARQEQEAEEKIR